MLDLKRTQQDMMLPLLGLLYGLLVILTTVDAGSISRVVECGEHHLKPGEVLTIKGSAKSCSWNFKAPSNGEVLATCKKLQVPRSKKCSKAALEVTSPEKGTVRLCGRKSYMKIDRNSDDITFTNKAKSGKANIFNCDVYLKMSTHTTTNCSCGTENPTEGVRIIGGTTTGLGQYPWVGGITFRGMKRHFCGLTLLSDSHALTAAHCLDGKDQKKLIAVLAEHDIKDTNETPRTIRKITKISFHPEHRPDRTDIGDLAVVTFDHPVPLDHRMVNPVCLPPSDAPDYAGKNAITAGWGSIDINPPTYATKLQAVRVPVWSNSDCRNTGFGNLIHDNLVCAGLPEGGADACIGDSGGPLTVVEEGQHVLVGTVSFGHYCALPNWPGVYSRISGNVDWIKQEIRDGIQCQN